MLMKGIKIMSANYKQLYEFVNFLTAQAFGESPITVVDSSSLVALGDYVFSNTENTNDFYNALPIAVGKVISAYKEISVENRDIQREPLEFGLILERLTVASIQRVEENRTFKKQIDDYWGRTYDITDVKSQFYSARGGFECQKVIYERQLKDSFHNAGEMASFLNMIYTDLNNAITQAKNDCVVVTECSAIAQSLCNANGTTHINLLSEYNTLTNESLTVASCLRDKEFLRWCSTKMKTVLSRMRSVSTFFNVANYERQLQNDFKIHVLADFATAVESYSLSDTFHNEFVKLPNYTEVGAWQGLGENGSFEDVSTVAVRNGEIPTNTNVPINLNTPFNISQSGVVAHIFGNDRMSVMFDYEATVTEPMPRYHRALMTHQCDFGAIIVPDEVGVVFYIAEDDKDNAHYPIVTDVDAVVGTETVLSKTVSNIQSNVRVSANRIDGELEYVSNWTQFSALPSENTGHFIALSFDAAENATIAVKITNGLRTDFVTLDSDNVLIAKINDQYNQELIVRTTLNGVTREKSYNFRGLTLKK